MINVWVFATTLGVVVAVLLTSVYLGTRRGHRWSKRTKIVVAISFVALIVAGLLLVPTVKVVTSLSSGAADDK